MKTSLGGPPCYTGELMRTHKTDDAIPYIPSEQFAKLCVLPVYLLVESTSPFLVKPIFGGYIPT